MKTMRLIPIVLTLTACQMANSGDMNAMNEYVQKLQWLDAADPIADARQAMKKGDYRLMAIAQRAIRIPAIDRTKYAQAEKKCGIHVMDGVTDFITSDEHRRLMKLARSYARQYNEILRTYCES